MPHVSCSPSKIPYVGFSPVRLQTGSRPRPSPQGPGLKRRTRIHPGSDGLYAADDGGSKEKVNTRSRTPRRPSGPSLVFRRPTQSRGPWLASGLCCPAGSSLTMASSEPLGPSPRLICFVQGGLCPTVLSGLGSRGSPICSACPFLRAAVRTPADRAAARGCSFAARSGLRHLCTGSASASPPSPALRWSASRGCNVRFTLRPGGLLALHRPGPLRSSFHLLESPPRGVEYHYPGTQPIPGAGLSPAGHAALWAASKGREEDDEERNR